MNRKIYVNERQDEAFERYQLGVLFQKDIEEVYDDIDFKIKQPDLLGKTVRVTEKQFGVIDRMLTDMSKRANIDKPEVYVYEDYFYGAESYGVKKPWIEVSAKTVQDFSEDEFKFVLAREIYKISDGVTKMRTMMDERFGIISSLAPKQLEKMSKLEFYHWYRLACFSADNYGYLECGSVKGATKAILLIVLNSRLLVENTNIKEFIEQASKINNLDDNISNYTKADEPAPYAPHRIQNILSYAVSERAMEYMGDKKLIKA